MSDPVVLYRDPGEPTDPCPFCGGRHWHGPEDGHRSPHCTGGVDVTADGFRREDGYVVRTRDDALRS